MKKYLFGLFAIALALGLSAFSNKKQISIEKSQPYLYWYYILPNGNIGNPVDGTNLRTKDEVFPTVGCEDTGGPDCARGYTTTQAFGFPAEPVTAENEHIKDRQ